MMMQSLAAKVRPDHLDRLALVYVRQSTMIQVRENIASTARQYDLAGRARDLGWPLERIQVIDQDQGHSGASAAGRDGFQHLVAQVGLGRTGAVLSLEASRLARSCINPAMNLIRKHEGLVVSGGTPIVMGRGAIPSLAG